MTGRPDLTAAAEVQALRNDLHDLRERERRMFLALDGSGTGVWDRDIVTNEIQYSRAWKAILGYSEDELSTQLSESYTRVHPDDLAYVKASMQAHVEGKTPVYEVEHRLRCKDGSYKWVCSRGKVAAYDSEGKALRMVGTTTDITALRCLSDQLQQTVNLVTFLTNEVPGLIFRYELSSNGQASFAYASAGIADIYELEPQQALTSTKTVVQRIHPADRAAYHSTLAASAHTLEPWHLSFRVQLPRQGLCWRQLDARPQRLQDGTTVWHGFITDVTARKQIEDSLARSALLDDLTQLPNRRHFMNQIDDELRRMRRDGDGCSAVLMCDLDFFKSINDQWGHAMGDKALQHFGSVLSKQLRGSDIAGRMGGEEFAILLRNCDAYHATSFARRLQKALANFPLLTQAQPIALTVSVGIAVIHVRDENANQALLHSDEALYRAKKGGRNRIECYQ